MSRWQRREFIKRTSLATAGLALLGAGCARQEPAPADTEPATSAATSANQAYMAVIHGSDPAAITQAAILALGGMKRFGYQVAW